MRIAIDVNGVLRDTIGKIKQIYEKTYLSELSEYKDETQKIFEVSDSGDLTEIQENETFSYGISEPISSLNLMDFFNFKNEDEYYQFLYEEFPMQIFGHAQSTELSTFIDFNNFYQDNRENHEILIVSDEIGKSKPATLFFISKFGCLTEKVKFFSKTTEKSLWDEIDVLLTANPDLLLNYPKDKVVIKYETSYNQDIESNLSIKELKELESTLKKLIK